MNNGGTKQSDRREWRNNTKGEKNYTKKIKN